MSRFLIKYYPVEPYSELIVVDLDALYVKPWNNGGKNIQDETRELYNQFLSAKGRHSYRNGLVGYNNSFWYETEAKNSLEAIYIFDKALHERNSDKEETILDTNTIDKLRDDWKDLRPQIGNFIGRLDNQMQKCEDSKTTFENGYIQGYNIGRREGVLNTIADRNSECAECEAKKFWNQFNEYSKSKVAYLYSLLNKENQELVLDMINKLAILEGKTS